MNELIELLRELEESRFYGSLEIKMESGQIVLYKKTESFKPTQAGYGNNRGTLERNNSH
jgi:hypothetical protein